MGVERVRSAAILSCALLIAAPVPCADARPAAARHQNGSTSSQAAPTTVDSREALQRAAHLVQQGHLEEAEAQAKLALSNPETRGAAHSVLGAIRFQQERLDESARLLQEAIRLEPRLIGAHLTLAEVRIAQGQTELAVALFRRALELEPMNQTARFGVARSEAEKGNFQASLDIARPVIEAFKLFPEGLFVLATSFLKTGDRQAASELVEHWNRSTDIPQAWSIRLAVLYAEEGVPAAAIKILEQAKTVAPVTFELAFNLGGADLLNGSRLARSRPMTMRFASSRTPFPGCARRRRSRRATGSSSGRSLTGCAPGRWRRTIPISSSVSAACASRWICWRTPSPPSPEPPA